jgi:hypothetical protein
MQRQCEREAGARLLVSLTYNRGNGAGPVPPEVQKHAFYDASGFHMFRYIVDTYKGSQMAPDTVDYIVHLRNFAIDLAFGQVLLCELLSDAYLIFSLLSTSRRLARRVTLF